MAWSSAIFQQAMLNPLARAVNAGTVPTGFTSLTADTLNVAVYDNSGTPSKSSTLANTAYGTTWQSCNEITGTGWTAGGVSVGSTKTWTIDTGSTSLCYQVTAPTAGQTSTVGVTLVGFYGALVYDASISGGTVANQGICFNYFGGTQTITAGTFTILWATPSGGAVTAIFNISV